MASIIRSAKSVYDNLKNDFSGVLRADNKISEKLSSRTKNIFF